MKKPKVEIIVVKYNQPDFEATTLERVASNTIYPNYTLTAYQNERGVALSKCWNKLIEQSDADFICLLNSDTVVTPSWLTNLMNVFDQVKGVGAVVPSSNKVFLSEVKIPFPIDTTNLGVINSFAEKQINDGRCVSLPTLSAMCVIFPKALWEQIGGFDEDFYLYGEDTEFFYRMVEKTDRQLIWYCAVYVHHYKAQSVQKAIADGELDYPAIRAKADKLCAEKMPNLAVSHALKE